MFLRNFDLELTLLITYKKVKALPVFSFLKISTIKINVTVFPRSWVVGLSILKHFTTCHSTSYVYSMFRPTINIRTRVFTKLLLLLLFLKKLATIIAKLFGCNAHSIFYFKITIFTMYLLHKGNKVCCSNSEYLIMAPNASCNAMQVSSRSCMVDYFPCL